MRLEEGTLSDTATRVGTYLSALPPLFGRSQEVAVHPGINRFRWLLHNVISLCGSPPPTLWVSCPS